MRNIYNFSVVLLFFIMLLLPLSAEKDEKILQNPIDNTTQNGQEEHFLIKTESGTKKLSEFDYLCGVVSAEMPALYENEALKAGAVAAYTYAHKKRSTADGEYHLTDNPLTDQCYEDEEKCREKWGEKYEEYSQKIRAAVESVYGEVITYGGEPIFAAYHAISGGRTESSKNIWGGETPYLCGVDSSWDKKSEKYKSEVSLTPSELKTALKIENLPEAITEWEIKSERSEAGTVLEFSICENKFKGTEVREALSLRSANFEVTYSEGNYIFTVYGSGHGVGMSQNGANEMAKQGKNYKEILCWYYPGCEIEKR